MVTKISCRFFISLCVGGDFWTLCPKVVLELFWYLKYTTFFSSSMKKRENPVSTRLSRSEIIFKADTLKRTLYITGFAHLCVPNFWT